MRPRLSLALLVLIALLGLVHVWLYLGPFEDAFITFRYVHNLLAGHGLVWNPGERVEGFTSFGWLALLAGLGALGAPYVELATWLSVLFGLALLPLTFVLARRYLEPTVATEPGSDTDACALGAAALIAANGTWAYYAGTGMETLLFAVLINAAVLCAMRSGPRIAGGAGALLALATLVRPEGLGYAGMCVAALLLSRGGRNDAIALAFTYAALIAPFLWARYAYFGFLQPNTYYAKVAASAETLRMGFLHLERYATPYLAWLALPAVGLQLRRYGRARAVCIAAAVIVAAMFNEVSVGGDTFAFWRFMLPAAPLSAIVLLGAIRAALAGRSGSQAPTRAFALVTGALVLWTAAVGWLPRFSLTGLHGRSMAGIVAGVQEMNRGYFAVGHWLQRRAPEHAFVALNAAGIVPFVSGLPVIDMLGLNDVHIAHAKMPLGHRMHGHEKYDVDYVLSRAPEIIVLGLPAPTPERLSVEAQRARYADWGRNLQGDAVMLSREDFHARYRAVQFRIDGAGYLVMFLRRDFALRGR